MAGSWTPGAEPIRPGLYINFVEAAIAQIAGGPRGVVAIPLKQFNGGTAESDTVYTVTRESEAIELFGVDNITSIRLALSGGAAEVVAYTVPEIGEEVVTIDGVTITTEEEAYALAFSRLEPYGFNVFAFDGEVDEAHKLSALSWVQACRDGGKHFIAVFGGNTDSDLQPALGNARSGILEDEYSVNLISGASVAGKVYNSSEYAPFIAGLIAGTAINRSITYANARADDVTKRLRNSDISTALTAGSLVLVSEGDRVRVEQGITTDGSKIRLVRAKQAISDDITRTAARNYIGKIDNNADGQAALIAAISAYLESLEASNVLVDPVVELDSQFASVGDKVYLSISFGMVDSVERIFLTINI